MYRKESDATGVKEVPAIHHGDGVIKVRGFFEELQVASPREVSRVGAGPRRQRGWTTSTTIWRSATISPKGAG